MIELLKTERILLEDGRINKNSAKMLKNRPLLLAQIVSLSVFLSSDAPLSERLYCILNNIASPVLCANCNNVTKYLDNKRMYQTYCSSKCASNALVLKEQRMATNRIKYGGNAPLCDPAVQNKSKNTNMLRYGTNWHQQSNIGKYVRVATNINRYGVAYPISTIGRAAFIKQYGVNAPILVPKIKTKIHDTVLNKYDRSHHNQLHLSSDTISKLHDKDWLSNQHLIQQLTLTEIAEQLQCDVTTIMNYCKVHNIKNIRFAQSSYERRLVAALTAAGVSNIITNTKQVISPKELDIYIPDNQLAIEICGLYWHADTHPRMYPNYHKDKFEQCKAKGIRLITIFEDELIHQFQKVVDKLLYILRKSQVRSIYARRCNIFEPSILQKKEFMNAYHIQGPDKSTITYGLQNGNDTVAMMSLKNKHHGVWEITRYCSVGKVIGGFGKLLNQAKRTLPVSKFETFADLRWGSGELYLTTGFIEEYTIPPTFYYIRGNRRMHRSNYMKCKLHKLIPNFDPNLTEFQNCDNAKLLRIWDCGKIKYAMIC
jgi:very-short-patch-repair endonuclease